jgi:hypothetical protein
VEVESWEQEEMAKTRRSSAPTLLKVFIRKIRAELKIKMSEEN